MLHCEAIGRLRHHFWGDYRATVVLVWRDALEAAAVLAAGVLGPGWTQSKKNPAAVVWFGSSAELTLVMNVLEAMGADRSAIDSIAHSIDVGDEFTVAVDVPNPQQCGLPF